MSDAQVASPVSADTAADVARLWTTAVAAISALAWMLGLGGLVIAAASGTMSGLSWPDLTIALAYPATGLLVAHVRQARGWSALTLASAVFSGLNVACSSWADRYYVGHLGSGIGSAWAAWAAGWAWALSVAGFSAIAIFPDGKLPSRRWWLAPATLIIGCSLVAAGNAVQPRIDQYQITNPFPWHVSVQATAPVGAAILAGLLGCLAAGLVKLRRADADGRRQIGWYLFGYAITAAILILAVVTDLPSQVLAVAPVAVAAGACIGILRYRLYDLDLVVNRTLVWTVLTVLSAAIYVSSIAFLQRLFNSTATLGGLVATGVVAVAFQPMRLRVQHVVNQLVYGYRDQPDAVLRELAQSLQAATDGEAVLPNLAETLGRSLRLRRVALDVDGGPLFRLSYGADLADLVEAATAQYGGTLVRLLISPRRGTVVRARDRRLLGDLAPSVAAAAEAHRLNRALETSRLRALATLAEEQRRMRRDLHDGLGPVLVGLRMTIASARRAVGAEPAQADEMLAEAHGDVQTAIEDVRRLAHDLRPPALDELGLAGALSDRLTRILGSYCALEFETAGIPEFLPAAIEVAAYRIATEAVMNVARHAQARHCVVRLRMDGDAIIVDVTDDGTGFSGPSPGIGLRSLRERAEELAGTVEITSARGEGTSIRAVLPVARVADGDQ